MKNILITGSNSYIGNSLKEWLAKYPDDYKVEAISVRGEQWKNEDFSKYDVVFHAAGIAHQKETDRNAGAYYLVNRDIAYNVAKKAIAEKVGQFIFLSSMSVYGMDTGVIDETTKPNPKSHYGKSKLEAEQLIQPLEDKDFKVAVIRPPMIYGKGCKGNYQSLSKLAKITPIFPKVENQRSMIYIDNLSEFVRLLIDNKETGTFHPQNEEYVCTSNIVNQIAESRNEKMLLTKLFNFGIDKMNFNLTNKLFGNLIYKKNISSLERKYNEFNFVTSIKNTETD
ncbi:NAD-dependent epimerase/dehydratase family protein [Sinobaca sp. H24]|uniref:NAD-dependent epimerase/dehydratase family protein n=1 Tax=Sinobaca sp. H24 TaxID=2923376 RepID=UPI00207AA5AB|nr:NAD-dependent epimerase/dehydratase family protein [Sinobaca sp. H24]